MKDEDIICTCMSVSVKDIRQAIDEGARTVQEVQDKTGAGTVCGVCNEDLEQCVNIVRNNRNEMRNSGNIVPSAPAQVDNTNQTIE